MKLSSSLENNIWDLDSIVWKDISELTSKQIEDINSIITFWYSKKIDDIEDILSKTFSESLNIKQETLFIVLISIAWYYLDNNFHSKLDELLWEFRLDLDEIYETAINLKKKYKNTDKYCFIAKNMEWFIFYYNNKRKKDFIDSDNLGSVEKISEEKIKLAIDELKTTKELFKEDRYYFNYLNTIISYTNYELFFISDEKLKQEYVSLVKDILSSYNIESIANEDFMAKIVFLANILLFNVDFDNEKFILSLWDLDGFHSFLKFYSWKDIDIKFNYVYIKDFTASLKYILVSEILDREKKIENIVPILETLSFYSSINSIKIFSSNLLYFILKKEKLDYLTLSRGIYQKIWGYVNDIYFSLYDSVIKQDGFNIRLSINVIKNLMVQFLFREYNIPNIDFVIYIDSKISKFLDIPYLKNFPETPNLKNFSEIPNLKNFSEIDSRNDWNFELWYLFKHKRFLLSVDIPYKPNNVDLENDFVYHFFQDIIDKILTINNFLLALETKLEKIKQNDIETFEHMERIWDNMDIIVEALKEDSEIKKQINYLKSKVPVKEFYKLLWYLHDIWKSENIEHINIYKQANARTDHYEIFSTILVWLFEWEQFVFNKNEEEENFVWFEKKYRELLVNDNFKENILEFFNDIKWFNLKKSIEWTYYIEKIFNLTLKLYKDLETDLWDLILIKENYTSIVSEKLKKKYDIVVKEEDINLFLSTLLTILRKISDLQGKDLAIPHINYWLHFFQQHKWFDFLSSVLYHHNYPNQEVIKRYEWELALSRFDKLFWQNLNYFDNDKAPINPDNKNFLMVLTTIVDLIDALLSKRSYQKWNIEIDERLFAFLTPWFREEIITSMMWEDFSDKNKTFDKIISILDREFKNNPYYEEFKKIILENKEEFLKKYWTST